MITEKDIKARCAEVLTGAGFNAVASEVKEGFAKPAVFVSVTPASATLQSCGGATEQVTDNVEIKYISAAETEEDCIETAQIIKKLILHRPFDIDGRHITIQTMEFDIENNVLYVYFDIEFIQKIETDEEFEEMNDLTLGGNV